MSKESSIFTAASPREDSYRPEAAKHSPFQSADSPGGQHSAAKPALTPIFAAASTPAVPEYGVREAVPASSRPSFILDEVVPTGSLQAPLRAIFGVDHDMNIEEIIQRLRALPGIRHISLVHGTDVGVLDSLRKSIGSLGFGDASIRIFGSGQPLGFVRYSNVLLGVQTIEGFHPGVKETLRIAAQEIHRLSSINPGELARQ
jgi:hypothetical protein